MPEYSIGVKFGATGLDQLNKDVGSATQSLTGLSKAFVQLPKVDIGKNITGGAELKKQADTTVDALDKLKGSFVSLPSLDSSGAVRDFRLLAVEASSAKRIVDSVGLGIEKLKQPVRDLKAAMAGGFIPKISVTSLDQLQAKLSSIQDKLRSNTNPLLFSKLTAESAKAQAAIAALSKSVGVSGGAFNKFAPGANAAGQALLNVGRVAQDAPFGFLGIANNLNPLLESFQRLRVEAGSSGKALKLLGTSLIGAGGIGLALSAVTFVASGGIETIKKFFAQFGDANENITKAKAFLAELKTGLDIRSDAAGSVAGEIAEVNSLISVVRDETAAKKDRLAAIQALQKINKSYFSDLSLEKSSLDGLAKVQEEYTKALVTAATIKGFSDEISKSSTELRAQKRALNDAGAAAQESGKKIASLRARLDNLNKTDALNEAGRKGLEQLISQETRTLGIATKAYKQQDDIVKKLAGSTRDLEGEMSEAIKTQLQLKPISTDTTTGKVEENSLSKRLAYLKEIRKAQQEIANIPTIDKKIVDFDTRGLTEKEIEDLTGKKKIEQALKDVAELIDTSEEIYQLEITKIGIDLKAGVISKEDADKAIKVAKDELQKVYTQQALVFEATVRVKPTVVLERADLSQSPEQVQSTIQKAIGAPKDLFIDLIANVRLQTKGLDKRQLAETKEAMEKEFLDYFDNFKADLKIDALISIGEGIGSIGSGKGIEGIVSPLVNTLADALSQIGKAMIVYGVKLLAVKKAFEATKNFFTSNPALLIVAGLGAVAAGALIRNQFQKDATPKFANGGIADGPLSGYGVELHGREMIIPLDKINNAPNFAPKSQGAIQVVGIIRGDDIHLSNNRVTRRKGRV